eukprot:Hpha_TRINITY_DN22919_c0_g1::TRINITY_DN22919_c0_g1_i1::g.154125::m.154125
MGSCSSANKAPRCDRCDGKHPTVDCKVFTKDRERHPDAQVRKEKSPKEEKKVVSIRGGKVKPMPMDNNCMFHCLAHGLSNGSTNSSMRKVLSKWLANNLKEEVNGGKTLGDLVKEEFPDEETDKYLDTMANLSRWGGTPELYTCTLAYAVEIRVWQETGAYEKALIREFKPPQSLPCVGTIDLLFNPRKQHYDILDIPEGSPAYKRRPNNAVLRTTAPGRVLVSPSTGTTEPAGSPGYTPDGGPLIVPLMQDDGGLQRGHTPQPTSAGPGGVVVPLEASLERSSRSSFIHRHGEVGNTNRKKGGTPMP